MPTFKNYAAPGAAPGQRRILAGAPGRDSLIFLRPVNAGGVDDEVSWGHQVYGWNEVEPAGFQGDVVTIRSTDQHNAVPFITGSTPTSGRVQLQVNPDSQIYPLLAASAHRPQAMELRYVAGPPSMHLTVGFYLMHGAIRTAATSDAAITLEVSMTPQAEIVDYGGAYYASDSYGSDTTPTIECQRVLGSRFVHGGGAPADVSVNIGSSGAFTTSDRYSGVPAGTSVQALYYAPGIGYALSPPTTSSSGSVPTPSADHAYGRAIVENKSPLYVALWAIPDHTEALR